MNEKTIDCAKIKAQIFLSYGIDLDETTIAVTCIILSEVKKTLAEQNKKLDTAIGKIDQSQKSLQVDKKPFLLQASMYGFGISGIGVCVAFTIFCFYLCFDRRKDHTIENLNKQVNWFKGYTNVLHHKNEIEESNFLNKYKYPELEE